MEHLGAAAQGVAKALRADRDDHEFLHVQAVVGVRAAVDDVHHRHRHLHRAGAAEIAVQGQAALVRGGLGHGHGHSQHRIRAQARLVLGAVQIDQGLVDETLLGGIQAHDGFGNLGIDVLDRVQHALAEVALLVAVAQFDGFARAGRSARGHRGASHHAGLQQHVGFHGRIAARIQDLARHHIDYRTHVLVLVPGSGFRFYRRSMPVIVTASARRNRVFLTTSSSAFKRRQQLFHPSQGPGVGAVRQGLFRIGMRFHEQSGHAARHCGARQHRDEFTLPAAHRPLPPRELHRMRGIEYHRAAGLAHDRERAHVRYQVVVAETRAALAHQDIVRAAGLPCLGDDVLHVPRAPETGLS